MICEQCPFGELVQTDSFICTHPYVKDCENASLYWPWQLDYENMEISIKKRNQTNEI